MCAAKINMVQDALDPIVEDAQLEAAVQEQIANAQAVIGACCHLALRCNCPCIAGPLVSMSRYYSVHSLRTCTVTDACPVTTSTSGDVHQSACIDAWCSDHWCPTVTVMSLLITDVTISLSFNSCWFECAEEAKENGEVAAPDAVPPLQAQSEEQSLRSIHGPAKSNGFHTVTKSSKHQPVHGKVKGISAKAGG